MLSPGGMVLDGPISPAVLLVSIGVRSVGGGVVRMATRICPMRIDRFDPRVHLPHLFTSSINGQAICSWCGTPKP